MLCANSWMWALLNLYVLWHSWHISHPNILCSMLGSRDSEEFSATLCLSLGDSLRQCSNQENQHQKPF